MNTEINLLEKQPKKYTNALILGIVFLLLLGLAAGVLLFQKNSYENQMAQQNTKLTQLESALADQDNKIASKRQLQQLQRDIADIQTELALHVSLYNKMVGYLSSAAQLITYETVNENQLIIHADFESLNDVADYVEEVLKQKFVVDTEITGVNNSDSSYQATLTIHIDSGLLKKELDKNV